jgi:hypothetical protein
LTYFGPSIEITARLGRIAAPVENDYETGRTPPGDYSASSCEGQSLEIIIRNKSDWIFEG